MEKSNYKICWEAYVAIICLIISFLSLYGFHMVKAIFFLESISIVLLILSTAFGIGFSISSIGHKGRINKGIGIVCLILYAISLIG